MKRIVLILLCTVFPLMVVAQATRPVRGVVFDVQGIPMADATLTAVGSAESTTSKGDGTFEMMVSPYTKFIEAKKEGFISAQAEVDGSYLVFKLAVDKKYLENKAKAEEEARLAELAKAKAEEEARIAEEKRLAEEKAAAEKAEQARKAAEEKARLAEEKRLAEAKLAAEKAEQARKVAEEKARIAEEKRLAEEKAAAEKAEQARKAAEEKARIAEEKRLAEEKLAAEKAEQARKMAEEKARLAEEKRRLEEEKRLATEKVVAEKQLKDERLAVEEKARLAEEKRLAAEKAMVEKQLKAEARKAKAEPWKEAKLKGYRSYVEASFAIDFDLMPAYSLHYIGGYQINNCLFVGLGTGVYVDGNENRKDGPLADKGVTTEVKMANEGLALNMVNVPIFLHFRANFVDRRCSPFFALSAGYRWSTNRKLPMPFQQSISYATSGFFATPQIGVDFRMNKRSSIYLSAGFNVEQKPVLTEYSATSVKYRQGLMYGAKLTLGFTF